MSFSAFQCPSCGASPTHVRVVKGIRRSRQCPKCSVRWTTYEIGEREYRFAMAALDAVKGVTGKWLPGEHRND